MIIKGLIGIVLGICIGIGCRWFDIPLPGPPAILGAVLALAMATGYTVTDRLLASRRTQTPVAVSGGGVAPPRSGSQER